MINPASKTYGPKAVHGVKVFQKDKKLTADGVVGERTWNALGVKEKVVEPNALPCCTASRTSRG